MTATASSPPDAAPTFAAVMAQAGDENFPVASRLVGVRRRSHLLAIYGFARLVDDVGDEVTGDRLALLDQLERELDAPQHPVMRALAAACTLGDTHAYHSDRVFRRRA